MRNFAAVAVPFSRASRLMLAGLLILAAPLEAQEAGNAAVTGSVRDALRGGTLRGAQVSHKDGIASATTDANGRFHLTGLPPGEIRLTVNMLGYEESVQTVTLSAGSTGSVDIKLEMIRSSIDVVGEPLFEGQAKALNEQLNATNIKSIVSADQIGRFPDPNAAEAAQRVPGVTIVRDQGEGRYVIVRGTEPRLNATLINGERLPAPEGDLRQVALDVIPADLLETIEVTKALTADMDADSIGGSVNLVTKSAPNQPRLSLTLGGGGNVLTGGAIKNFNGTWGRRSFGGRLGYLFSGNFFETDRGSEGREPSWDDGQLSELELRDYRLRRTRAGLTSSVDYRLGESSSLNFRGIFNSFEDDELRRRVISVLEDNLLERTLRERYEAQQIQSYMFSGSHLVNNLWSLNYRFTYAYAQEDEPKALESVFQQEDVEFRPSVSGDQILTNPANEALSRYLLDEIESGVNFTSDRDVVGSIDLARPFRFSDTSGGILKFGGRFRDKSKRRENTLFTYKPEDDLTLDELADPAFQRNDFLQGSAPFPTGFLAPGRAASLIRGPGFEEEFDEEENLADYDAGERVQAGYVMTELHLTPRLLLLPGLRVERTAIDYRAPQLLFDEEGDFAGRTSLQGSNNYANWLPSFHLRYRLSERSNVRAAYTRSLARPNYSDLPPFELVLREDREIFRGNPALKTTTSNNFDLLAEHYLSSVGVISGGYFHKRINNSIFLQRRIEDVGGERFEIEQPQNGQDASLHGLEIAFQNRFSNLPGALSGLGIYANLTATTSSSNLLDRTGVRLPGQAGQTANLAVSYERRGFSGRLSWNYQGTLLDEVGEDADRDIFLDSRQQLDLSVSQRLTKNLRLFFDALNLTNRPYRTYEGVTSRPTQVEFYRQWVIGGLKIDF
jgi:TonB-dependent receptor